MWSSSNFGEAIPIWDLPPVLVGLIVLGLDFGVIMAIRIGVEGKFYFTRWWSFRWGDSVGLPVLAVFAAVVVREGEFTGFYTELWWHILVFAVGCVISLSIQIRNILTGFFTWEDITNPSEMYHAVIFGIMFYLIGTVVFALAADREPTWVTVLALTGLAIYVLTWLVDQTPLVDKTSGRISPKELVIVLRK